MEEKNIMGNNKLFNKMIRKNINKKIYVFILISFLTFSVFTNEVNANDVEVDNYINNNGIIISTLEYENLINLGFTENEILNMEMKEFEENKNLIGNVISSNDRYYKVVTRYDNENNIVSNISEEINKNIYNTSLAFNNINLLSVDGYSETNYKKIRVQIISLTSGYRYKITVEWKNMPSVRSYDIIGIGIDTNVYISSDIIFQQNYCYSNGNCSSSNTSNIKKSTTGGAALFKLPTSSSITSLNSYLYFMVDKSSSSTTISKMYAYGDYSHATEKTNSSNVNYYNINNGGINLYASIIDSYDAIPITKAIWEGTW